jgi:hypothetical protein
VRNWVTRFCCIVAALVYEVMPGSLKCRMSMFFISVC